MIDYIIVSAIIIGIILLISVYIINLYNKLKLLQNEIEKYWLELKIGINYQFSFVETNIKLLQSVIDINKLQEFINGYKLMAGMNDIMVAYVTLEKNILGVESPLLAQFKVKNDQINNVKKTYNDFVLGYNNIVNFFPKNFICKLLGYHPGIYFISKD